MPACRTGRANVRIGAAMNPFSLTRPWSWSVNTYPSNEMSPAILFIILLVLIVVPLVIALFQWLWNITMPQVFGLKVITFWQGFRLLLIAGMLFGRWHTGK